MSEKNDFISPIAVDLGAKNTGVYFTHYKVGSSLDEIQKNKKGIVYKLDNYTLLMQERTIHRHQKRGLDRRQMLKRLFKLIWIKHFKLEWNHQIQQALSFLLNRRGFTFLTEEYDPEVLEEFPLEILEHEDFPKELKDKLLSSNSRQSEFINLHQEIENLSKKSDDLKKVIKLLKYEERKIKRPLFVITRIRKLKDYCNEILKTKKKIKEKGKVKLSELPMWVLEDWKKRGIKSLPETNKEKNSVDLTRYLNELSQEKVEEIFDSIPKTLEEEKQLQNSIWNRKNKKFEIEKFRSDLDKFSSEEEKNKLSWIQTHLHHLEFALEKTENEITSGGRHRSKYFQEVEEVLNQEYNEKSPKYLKNFCYNLKSGKYSPLDREKLKNLIGNLSNFELNLLRSYFNHQSHIKADQWKEKELNEKFKHWIKNIWRVNPKKDRDKGDDGKYSYKKLKEKLKNKNIIDFFLNTDPNLTIPPYQNKDNRHPPKCQSLILNINYLDQNYENWEEWLEKLKIESKDYIEDYEIQLKDLKSDKEKSYFGQEYKNDLKKDSGKRTEKHLKARVLQFIFDRSKKQDKLKLNQIYSYVKRLKERDNKNIEKLKEKLQKTIDNLPEELKSSPNFDKKDIFQEDSFLHLTCEYYKMRHRARAGRLFIHPKYNYVKNRGYENTGRFEESNHLLIYCNHKPRRKHYQTFEDLSSVLQISSQKLRQKVRDSDELIEKLKEIKGLKSNCSKIAEEQKERRSYLKLDINSIYKARKEIDFSNKKNKEEKLIKEALKATEVKDADSLYKLCEKAKELYIEILNKLDRIERNEERKSSIEENLKDNPAIAFYLLSQVNNIAFKERNGNASTCLVCSMDNSERMQLVENSTKASRLSAISTRMINGAIMRMNRIITKAIAEEKWETIKDLLKDNKKVSIPIITESNEFEFEPSKEELIKNQRINPRKGKLLDEDKGFEQLEKEYKDKRNRIKEISLLCPYTGKTLSNNEGEIDHIIPRSSQYGTLNDEANLIYASREGNTNKGNEIYSLFNLNEKYKKEVFGKKDDKEIEEWIKDKIWDEDKKGFLFGKYKNFSYLDSKQQKAFKHALFLVGNHPLRKEVIQAIDNRNRSFVNGTQRYFAEVLANQLYKKAKKEKLEHLLNFDYFSLPSKDISEIRKDMENLKKKEEDKLLYQELEEYKKKKGEKQTDYSHLIDAQVTFISSFSKYYKELKQIPIDVFRDYEKIKISKEDFEVKNLERRSIKPKDTKISHQAIFNSKAGAWHFLKLIEIKIDESSYYLNGFLDFNKLNLCLEQRDWSKIKEKIEKIEDSYHHEKIPIAQLLKEKKELEIVKLYEVGEGKHQFGYQKNEQYPKMIMEKNWNSHSEIPGTSVKNIKVFLHNIDKTKVAKFLLNNFNTKSDPKKWKDEDCQILDQLKTIWYHTKKIEIQYNAKKKEIEAKKKIQDILKFNKDFKFNKCFNSSLFYSWKNLDNKWNQFVKNEKPEEFLKKYFINQYSRKNPKILNQPHQKVRKRFSLPLKSSGQGWFLVKRRIWEKDKNTYIYQCLSEENIPKFGSHKDTLKDILHLHFRQNNLFLFSTSSKNLKEKLDFVDDIIDSDAYFERDIPEDLLNLLEKIENKTSNDNKRAYFRFTFNKHLDENDLDKNFMKIINRFPIRRFVENEGLKNLLEEYSKESIKSILREFEELKRIEEKSKTKEEDDEKKKKNDFYSEVKKLYDKVDENILEYQTNTPFSKKKNNSKLKEKNKKN
ncbi:MAG: type II-B CRISPR-associated RNA-guided endonuclease Cas9/Csx12 [Bdellovibrionales bacterium]|nr:type II-B CRISPR-associated RNA-guided endonuclease Cas9/Csx12 [Bdellovibrionales bacterium]